MFSSSAVKLGHGFMILNLTLEFEYLLGGCPQDETSIWGLVSTASWYTAKFWSTTPVVLSVARLQLRFQRAQHHRHAVEAPLMCRQQANLAEGPSTYTFGTHIMTGVPITTTYVMTFTPGMSVADLHVSSVREAFALQCGVSTAAVTFESEPLDGCP